MIMDEIDYEEMYENMTDEEIAKEHLRMQSQNFLFASMFMNREIANEKDPKKVGKLVRDKAKLYKLTTEFVVDAFAGKNPQAKELGPKVMKTAVEEAVEALTANRG